MTYDCRFLGAAEDIGRLGFVLETESQRMLFDYGIAPDKPPLYPIEAPSIDQMFLTHAHMDHSGMVPWLHGRHDGTILTTKPTAEVSALMQRDSLKIAKAEGFPEPFEERDIVGTEGMYRFVRFGQPVQVGDVQATLESAGHIPGAAQVHVEGGSADFVFTGDLYTRPQRLVGAGEPVSCDVLAMETTYAGREHIPREQTEEDFIGFVEDRVDAGGMVLAAAFAVGRAQELAMVLADQGFNVWMDGMARRVSTIFRHNRAFLRDADEYDDALRQVKYVRGHPTRDEALVEADVIITTSGMLEGGPVLYYLSQLRDDRRAGLALTGYQVGGTNGRRLVDSGEINLDMRAPGADIAALKMKVEQFDFSAHAGHKDMVDFARATGAGDIILFHGDRREALAADLRDFADVHMPMRGEEFRID
jgi:putative mRNA 3-end processing factor